MLREVHAEQRHAETDESEAQADGDEDEEQGVFDHDTPSVVEWGQGD